MASKKWNDMHDSSSMEESSDDEIAKILASKKTVQASQPALQKVVSMPEPEPHLNKNSKKNKIEENLTRLASHKDDRVWLYVFNFFKDKAREVDTCLRNEDDFIRVQDNQKAWNVLTKTQCAAKYIQKGIWLDNLQIRFEYSNRNQYKSPQKLEKKYSEKYREQGSYQDLPQATSPRMRPKQSYNDRPAGTRTRDGYEGDQKKKVRYIAKKDQEERDQAEHPKSKKDLEEGNTHQGRLKQQAINEVKSQSVKAITKEQGGKNQEQRSNESDTQETGKQTQAKRKNKKNKKKSSVPTPAPKSNDPQNPFSQLMFN